MLLTSGQTHLVELLQKDQGRSKQVLAVDDLTLVAHRLHVDQMDDKLLVGGNELLEELDACPREPVVQDSTSRLLFQTVYRLCIGVKEGMYVGRRLDLVELGKEWRGHVDAECFDARWILGQAVEQLGQLGDDLKQNQSSIRKSESGYITERSLTSSFSFSSSISARKLRMALACSKSTPGYLLLVL